MNYRIVNLNFILNMMASELGLNESMGPKIVIIRT